MKLVIKEYLASLKERKELDALLPDLLSQMGLEVFSRPGIGNRQYGVDVAAFGSLDGQPETVYLFSIKSGDLGRADWDSDPIQSLRPSLNEIKDVYIPTHLPTEYKSYPIEICLCFGGDLKQEVTPNISTYTASNSSNGISFSIWSGDKLSAYIEKYFLREELLPKHCRPLLRKSLALLDEPDASYRHFSQLVASLSATNGKSDIQVLTSIRQLHICLWILYSWCREAGNLEAAYLASELVLLHAWNIDKDHISQGKKASKAINQTMFSTLNLAQQIGVGYTHEKIMPHAGKLYAISNAVHPSCKVDVNLKLFDVLSRVAISGIWIQWYLERFPLQNNDSALTLEDSLKQHRETLIRLIENNPILYTPYKDDQGIDIFIAAWFLMLDKNYHEKLHDWLHQLMQRVRFLYDTNGSYPCNIDEYHELIEHPLEKTDSYKEEVTAGSILFPYISAFSAALEFDDVYESVKALKTDILKHSNFQAWYPDDASEDNYYLNMAQHGAALSHINVDDGPKNFLTSIFRECEESKHFQELSAIKSGLWPIIFVASRHYRIPVPIDFIKHIFESYISEIASEGQLA